MKYYMITFSTAAALFGLVSGAMILTIEQAWADDGEAACMVKESGPALSDDEITAILEKAGYKVGRIEVEEGCLEARVWDKEGKRMEVLLNPETGAIVKTED